MSAPMHVRLLIVVVFGAFLVALNAVLSLMPAEDQLSSSRPLHPNVGARP